MSSADKVNEAPSFSFDELVNANMAGIGAPIYIQATDGLKLACYLSQARHPVASLVFIHGGGAHSGAGYQRLGKLLPEKYNVSTCLMDLRGHGNSEGPRGDSPSLEQVWRDVEASINYMRTIYPDVPVFLGGHSSGAGLVLNYITWHKDPNLSGYIFISPQLGYKSLTERPGNPHPFAVVDLDVFVKYGMSQGVEQGNTPAVFFNYPDEVLRKDPLLIKSITVNMSLAITPDNPQEQFREIDKPFALFIGGNDELFDTERVISYAELPKAGLRKKSTAQIVENTNHLSILLAADRLIGTAIPKMISKR